MGNPLFVIQSNLIDLSSHYVSTSLIFSLIIAVWQEVNISRRTYTTMATVQESRVEDFLNDKFQTLADLDTLDSLLSSVQSQQSLLKSQV